MDIESKVKKVIMESIDGVDTAGLTRDSDMDSVEGWDSLHFLDVVLGLEREFEIKFNAGEVARLFSVGNIVDLVAHKTAGDAACEPAA